MPKSFTLLFSSFKHGWKKNDWRKSVMGKGSTLTIMKSTKGKVCGAYMNIEWKEDGEDGKDKKAFIFSVDHSTTYYPNPNSHLAVYF